MRVKVQVIKYIKQADLFVFPTISESFLTIVIEVIACEIPVVTTDIGAASNICEKESGFIIEAG